MTTDTLIMFSGAFVAILPFLGFPNSWDTVLFFIAGVVIIALGIVVRRQGGLSRNEKQDMHHVEHAMSVRDEHDAA